MKVYCSIIKELFDPLTKTLIEQNQRLGEQ